jgi:hypothetical protein
MLDHVSRKRSKHTAKEESETWEGSSHPYLLLTSSAIGHRICVLFQRRTGTEPIIGFLVSTMGADGCS